MGQARGYYTFFGHLKWTPVIFLGYIASIYVHVLMTGLPWWFRLSIIKYIIILINKIIPETNDASLNLYDDISLYKNEGKVSKLSLLKKDIIVKSPKVITVENENTYR